MSRRVRLPILMLAVGCLGLGPCGPIPGGRLPGEASRERIEDWSFVHTVPRCAVEVRPEDPHSVTVNCMSWQDRLYVSCSVCASKYWARLALDHPEGRVRVGDRVHRVRYRRVTDPAELDAVWLARDAKLGSGEAKDRPESWWTFELVAR